MSRSNISNIAGKIAQWGWSVQKFTLLAETNGYNMSGLWHDYYQRYLFPDKTLHVERLTKIIKRLKYHGFVASLEIAPFENGTGIWMYMKLRPIPKV